jgi:hypothetical protein
MKNEDVGQRMKAKMEACRHVKIDVTSDLPVRFELSRWFSTYSMSFNLLSDVTYIPPKR